MTFEKELEVYHRELPRLLAEGLKGRIVVIRGDEVLGTWADLEQALEQGYARYGLEPFFTRIIGESETPIWSPRSVRPCPYSVT